MRAYAEAEPGDGFTPVPPTLEDVYFATIRNAPEGAATAEAA